MNPKYNLQPFSKQSMEERDNSKAESEVQSGEERDLEGVQGIFDQKCQFGRNAPKIDKIYSKDSNIETADVSAQQCIDLQNQIDPLIAHGEVNLKQQFSMPEFNHPEICYHFRKYQSELFKYDRNERREMAENEGITESGIFERALVQQNNQIILEEDRESNQTLILQPETSSLGIESLLKKPQSRAHHSFLISPCSKLLRNEKDRCETLDIVDQRINPKTSKLSRDRLKMEGGKVIKEDDRISGLTESPIRKNACLKKKGTLTFKDSSEPSFQQEESWQGKQFKKVVFKGSEKEDPAHKHSPEKTIKQPMISHFTPKKFLKRGESIISICLSKNQSNDQVAQVNTALIKSSKTLHDLGSNHLIYRLKKTDRNAREKACQIIEVQTGEQERRQNQIVTIMQQYPHRNLLKVHSMTKSKDFKGDRTTFLQIIDFYPRNLEQYLIDLSENETPPEQVSFQRKLILLQILNGLKFMHSNNLLHRNLTPYSILLNDSLEVVIAGFSSMDSPAMISKSPLKCDWLIRPPEIILEPSFPFSSSGDIWEFGCLVVYMLKQQMPFVEHSDASMILEMSKCMGRITAEDRSAIGFKNHRKFIFPNLRRESMNRSFKCNDPDLMDLLKKVFVFNPLKRASAGELMKCRYFEELRVGCKNDNVSRFNQNGIFYFSKESIFQPDVHIEDIK